MVLAFFFVFASDTTLEQMRYNKHVSHDIISGNVKYFSEL